MKGRLIAAEPELLNPVAFCFDEQGRLYVAETFRQSKGVEDNRGHMHWLLDDLAAQTVADRVAYMRKHIKDADTKYTAEEDRVRRLEDRDGDGVYEHAEVFADNFRDIADGTGAGLLAFNGNLYYTCIPHLWLLKDTNSDGRAEVRQSLSEGYGVRFAFRGHDSHGLTLGPDGRVYFSIGDRGYHIRTKEGKLLHNPDRGAVFRCEPDGSNLEVFATGLRNPQELAFDDFGNLFTGDNNSDSGDRARWVYVMEGGDTGWRMYYQYLPDRGPWNREKLWHPPHDGQAAYIVPPITNFADGPSGLTHYPGVGLPDTYRDHFFLADFRGSAGNSGIRSFTNKKKGAGFELTDSKEFLWSILTTDVEFGYDGAVYVSDWVDGWEGLGKGRIYRFEHEEAAKNGHGQEVARLFREGFHQLDVEKLEALLDHADYRVRQRAQFALVAKSAVTVLQKQALGGPSARARVHGIWGIGQLARRQPSLLQAILPVLNDENPDLRANVARVIGEAGWQGGAAALVAALQDADAHPRAMAALALAKLRVASATEPLLDAVAASENKDPWLRHALASGLAGCATPAQLAATVNHPSTAVRLAAVVALRHQSSPQLALFLNDADPLIRLEAGRAIHDLQVVEAFSALAQLATATNLPPELLRRALNANFRIGGLPQAQLVAQAAGNSATPDAIRIEAVKWLQEWNEPNVLDHVLNDHRPLPPRRLDLAGLIRTSLPALFAGPAALQEQAAKLASQYGVKEVAPFLLELVQETNHQGAERIAALQALVTLKTAGWENVAAELLDDRDVLVRSEARRLLAAVQPDRVIKDLEGLVDGGDLLERQLSIATLAAIKSPASDRLLLRWLDQLASRKAPPEVWLDLLQLAATRDSKEVRERIAAFEKGRAGDDHLAHYREALAGGSARRGAEIFFTRTELSCVRCHKVDGVGGEVGPDLSELGATKSREYLLEAILDPNRAIAKGFDTAILQTDEGKVHVGIIKSEDAEKITLQTVEGAVIAVDPKTIEDRAIGKSGMPEGLAQKMSKSDLRDLVEFLASLKQKASDTEHGRPEK